MNRTAISRRAFLQSSAVACAAPLLSRVSAAESAKTAPVIAYVGTYSSPLHDPKPTQVDRPSGNGQGIHLFKVDRATGNLSPYDVVAVPSSPSCLAINEAGTHLYAGNETARSKDGSGTVSAFAIDRADGKLKLLNTVDSGGAGPAHLSVHPSGHFVLVANYFGGSVAVLPVQADGSLGAATQIQKDEGAIGPTKATNAPAGSFAISGHDQAHAHMIEAHPAGRFVVHSDLGLDRLYVWKFDERAGLLSPADVPSVQLPAGDGPRHFAFHRERPWLYSLQEEASTIVLFDFDAATGSLKSRQQISALPAGFAGSSFGSEILIAPNGRFLYAGNRLHDSIAIFSIGGDGTLTYLGEEWTRGSYPRSFNFDPSGTFLYCCNQRGDHVAVFRVDRTSGALAFTGHYQAVGNPSIIVFRDLATAR
jgi:6-phosphogluconolactonase